MNKSYGFKDDIPLKNSVRMIIFQLFLSEAQKTLNINVRIGF